MKLPLHLITFIFALLFSTAAFSQTTTYTTGVQYCGVRNSALLYCDGIPITNSAGVSGTIWMDYRPTLFTSGLNQGTYGFIDFLDNYEGLGTSHVINILPNDTIQFTGTDSAGVAYNGSYTYYFHTYRGCVSGRVSRCSTYWVITGGSLSITKVDY